MHQRNSFLTITYDNKHLPENGQLDHRDIQLFLKKLRRHVIRTLPRSKIQKQKTLSKPTEGFLTHSDKPAVDKNSPNGEIDQKQLRFFFPKRKKQLAINYVRYYMCGEYGEKTDRAHYHMILFGFDFDDDKKMYTISGSRDKNPIYKSKTLDKIWGKGNCYVGDVTFESAAYVARYIMKKVNGQLAEKHYERLNGDTGEIFKRQPEYTRMSLKPGIGAKWLEKYSSDVYPEGTILARGHKSKSPKYYDQRYKAMHPLEYEDLLFEREKEGKKNAQDNTPERLATRERVAKAKVAFLKRNNH